MLADYVTVVKDRSIMFVNIVSQFQSSTFGHIGVARILSAGVHFFTTQQKLLKIDSCCGWGGGALSVLRGCTYTFFL